MTARIRSQKCITSGIGRQTGQQPRGRVICNFSNKARLSICHIPSQRSAASTTALDLCLTRVASLRCSVCEENEGCWFLFLLSVWAVFKFFSKKSIIPNFAFLLFPIPYQRTILGGDTISRMDTSNNHNRARGLRNRLKPNILNLAPKKTQKRQNLVINNQRETH